MGISAASGRASPRIVRVAVRPPITGRDKNTVKSEPLSGRLSTTICPPMSFTSWSEMAIPRPVPPKRRVVLVSSCSKGRKIRLMNSAFMPMPV